MRRPILILAALPVFFSCRQAAPSGSQPALVTPFNREQGSVTEYYDNGNIRAQYTRIDGQLQGQYLYYRPDGTLERSSFYKDNILDGASSRYYEDGQRIRSIQNYKDGKREGFFTLYYRNGAIRMKRQYKDDRLLGNMDYFAQDGQWISHYYYSGKYIEGQVRFYHLNGAVSEEFSLVKGLCEGLYTAFYENGSVRKRGRYLHNQMVGDWYFFDREGNETVVNYDD